MVVSTSSTDEGLNPRDNRWLRRALWRPSRIHPPPAPPHGGLDELDRREAAGPTRGGSTAEGAARPPRGEPPDSGLRGRPGRRAELARERAGRLAHEIAG